VSRAESKNARSSIYLGIHWAFDATAGIAKAGRWRTTSSSTRSGSAGT